jgi:bacterioferritin
MNGKPFLTDIKTLRDRARRFIQEGAVTPGYRADRATVVKVLNEALATEIVCVLRYKRHQFMAKGIHAGSVAQEFAEHASEEQAHADMIAERIVQLGGEPDYSPASLVLRSHSEYVEGGDLVEMIQEDLVAERVAIDSYAEIVRFLGSDDPTSRSMMETILAKEEEHANDMLDLLAVHGKLELPKKSGAAPSPGAPQPSAAQPTRKP